MAVRWDLLQPVDVGGMFTRGYERGKAMVQEHQTRNALAAFGQNPMDPAAQSALAAVSPEFAMKLGMHKFDVAEKAAERARLGAYFGGGDLQTSRKQALAAGDIDVAKQLGDLDDEQLKRLQAETKAIAPAAYQALKLPYEQRKAYFQSIGPQLNAVGFTPDEVAAFDPSDEALNGIIQTVQTLEQAREQDTIKWHTPTDRAPFATDQFGNVVDPATFRRGSGGGGTVQPPAPVGQPGDLTSFQDPGYDTIEAALEQKYKLPPGLMKRIRTLGERSNAGQVSPKGAQTVYQVTPGTRKLFFDKYGVDAYSSPQAAAEVAALHLSESIERGEDPVRGYIGGPDQSQWGPQTQAYADRVGPAGGAPQTGDDKLQILKEAREAIAAGAPAAAVNAELAKYGMSL